MEKNQITKANEIKLETSIELFKLLLKLIKVIHIHNLKMLI